MYEKTIQFYQQGQFLNHMQRRKLIDAQKGVKEVAEL